MMGEGLKRDLPAASLTRLDVSHFLALALLASAGPQDTFAVGILVGCAYGDYRPFSASAWAGRLLARLRALGLVEKPQRGLWQITDRGRSVCGAWEKALRV